MTFSDAAAQLHALGYFIWDDLLESSVCESLRVEGLLLSKQGDFEEARIGKGVAKQRVEEVRSDLVHWLQREEASEAVGCYWNFLDELRTFLSDYFRIRLVRTELHFALYPPGAFYDRHFDQFRGSGNRIFSVILYLNPGWNREDGGALRIHRQGGHFDIAPLFNRLLCFRSDAIEHEVLVTHALRLSLTGWIRRDELIV